MDWGRVPVRGIRVAPYCGMASGKEAGDGFAYPADGSIRDRGNRRGVVPSAVRGENLVRACLCVSARSWRPCADRQYRGITADRETGAGIESICVFADG